MNIKNAIFQVSLPAKAKVNLFLAITGKREDGFHEVNSVLSTIKIFDQVTLFKTDQKNEINCVCEGDVLLSGSNNLAYRAIEEWRKYTGDQTGILIKIFKRIPIMAGLGGGSSNAAATLRGINLLHGQPLKNIELMQIAEKIGSDCPFFLSDGLCNVSGRGEIVKKISDKRKKDLNGQKIFLFQPPIGFSTPRLYEDLARESLYSDSKWATDHVLDWEKNNMPYSKFCYNDFESFILKKYLFLPPLFKKLKEYFELECYISGSGSCCYILVEDDFNKKDVVNLIKQMLGIRCRFWSSTIDYG